MEPDHLIHTPHLIPHPLPPPFPGPYLLPWPESQLLPEEIKATVSEQRQGKGKI